MYRFDKQFVVRVGDFESTRRMHQNITSVLTSGILTYGKFTWKLERTLAELHGAKFGVFMNSGTSALQVALQALKEMHGWQDGDEVIVPAVTFVATANVVLHNRLMPVFVDVDRHTFNINPELIWKALTPRTRAIIPVHLCGLSADMQAIMEIARQRNLYVVEDACEAMLATQDGRRIGSWGEVACFSHYLSHYIIGGVGGTAITSSPALEERMRSLMVHGADPEYFRNKLDLKRRFRYLWHGHSFRATELEAAIAVAQLHDVLYIVAKRRAIANRYIEGWLGITDKLMLPVEPPGFEHGYMMFPIATRQETSVRLMVYLEKIGVETRPLLPMITQPCFAQWFTDAEKMFPTAFWLKDHAFYIGCHQKIKRKHQNEIIERVCEFFKG